ncbi:MAG: glycosyltransferase [Clostridia bacterium]|nr:glycosyltransferase [Clostridia bacterium]
MENLPLISVIIPVYNVEKYLEECVNSVLAQTYKNIEIILVDDGSTDSSGKLCDSFAENHSNIKVFHKENGGQSTARNMGLEKAQGKYIYFLDSDDIIVPDALEKLCAVAEADCADVVFFDALSFIDEKPDAEMKQTYLRTHKYPVQSGIKTFELMQNRNEYHCVVWGMLLRKELLKKNDIEFIPGIYYEDMAYTYELLCRAGTVSQCPEVLYKRRYRENSTMTSKKSKKYFDSSVAVYEYIRDFSFDNNLTEFDFAKKYIARNAFNVFNNYYLLNKQDKKLCQDKLSDVKKDILRDNAYSNTALKMKCYSNLLWVVYKFYEKTIGRF